MTADINGRLLLIAEGGADPGLGSRGWSGRDQAWARFAVERSDGFEPTSLTHKANGNVLLLERRYTEAEGPAARVSLVAPPLGDRAAAFTLGVLRRPLTVDNFEAIAVRPAADGRVFVYLLSDDNQSDQQRTLLLQFRTTLD